MRFVEYLTEPNSTQKQWEISPSCANMSCTACCTCAMEKEQLGLSSLCHNAQNTAEAQKCFGTYWKISQCPTPQILLKCRNESSSIHFNLVCYELLCMRLLYLVLFFHSKSSFVRHSCSSLPSQLFLTFRPSFTCPCSLISPSLSSPSFLPHPYNSSPSLAVFHHTLLCFSLACSLKKCR